MVSLYQVTMYLNCLMRLHRIGKTEKTDKWGENDKLIIVGIRGGRVTKHKMDNC